MSGWRATNALLNRRALLVAAGASFAARAEQSRAAKVGWLTTGPAFPRSYFVTAMKRRGWIGGRNLTIVVRVTGSDPSNRKRAIEELVAADLDMIVAGGTTDALPLAETTRTIPVVVIAGTDLVEAGLVERLAGPGRAAVLTDKILNGAAPADLPVERPAKFELVANDTTAKELRLSIPPSILARADEVVE